MSTDFDASVGRRSTAGGGQRTALAARSSAVRTERALMRSVRSLEPIGELEAASFAGRFAADWQSWDEDNPTRRAEVLRTLLADPRSCTWGWSGEGRQRADSPLPGRMEFRSEVVVFVEVTVRVTAYARACPAPDATDPVRTEEPYGVVAESSAPPECDPRWAGGAARWVRMTVPVTRNSDDGRLVVDPELVPDPSS